MLHCVPARCEREVVGIVDGFCVEELRSVWKDDDAPDRFDRLECADDFDVGAAGRLPGQQN
jgi:hypothetical protein